MNDSAVVQEAPDLIGVGAQALVDDAKRLGLTWTIQPATVDMDGDQPTVLATYDGDKTSIGMVNTTGIIFPAGQRVYALSVPPSGNFIVGVVGSAPLAYRTGRTLGSSASTVSFDGIPSSLRKLEISWTARSTTAAVAANLRMRINNNSSNVYNANFMQLNNTTLSGNIQSAATFWQVGVIAGGTAATDNFGSGVIVIPGWNLPHPNLNHQHTSHFYESGPNSWYEAGGGLYFAAGEYTRVDFFCDLGSIDAKSQFLLLGYA